MKADDIPSECIEEPRFIKVLAASLCSEIAETKVALNETIAKIQEFKGSVMEGWEKRKTLKQSIEDMTQQKQVLSAALDSLVRETKNRSIEVEIVKNRLDDTTLCEVEKRNRFEKIIQNYKDTWTQYKDEYEKLPLAIKRRQCCVEVKRASVEHMTIEYKMKELKKMIQQRENILSLQIKASIVDFSKMVLQRWKDDKYLENLKSITAELEGQLNTYTLQLAEIQREIDNKRQAESEDAEKMPPPRLHFPFMCSIIYPNADEKAMSRQQRSRNLLADDIDTASVNTLMLEEMCAEDDDDMNENMIELDQVLVKGGKSNVSPTAMRKSDSNFQSTEDLRYPNKKRTSTPMIIDESTDKIRDKIESLEIEKKNVSRCEKEFSKQRNAPKKNLHKSNGGNKENNDNDHVRQASNPERTINRFEEKTKILSPTESETSEVSRSGIMYETIEKKKRDQMIHSDSRYFDSEAKKVEKRGNKNDEIVEMTIQSKSEKGLSKNRYTELPENEKHSEKIVQTETPSSPVAFAYNEKNHDPEPEIPNRRRQTLPSATNNSSIHRNRYELSPSTNDHEYDDSSFRETPKKRRIDNVDYSSAFFKSVHERAPQGDPKTSGQHNSSPPCRSYVASCVSSENLSNIADWPKISRGIFPEVRTDTDFTPIQNWDNWSPTRQISVLSFSPSSFVSTSKNNDSPEKRKEVGAQRNLPVEKPHDNCPMSTFFKTTTQKSRGSFL